jgi:integrase
MTFMTDVQELKPGLIIYRRTDVQHRKWYCRIKLPNEDRYKRISLGTTDINEARDKAFHHDIEVHFKVRHQVPVFDKSFADVALEYSAQQKRLAEIGQITENRWRTVDGHIRLHLIPYIGNYQITTVGDDRWTEYPFWRKKNNAPRSLWKHPLHRAPKAKDPPDEAAAHQPAKDGTIRQEMVTFRAVMNYAARKKYIPLTQVPDGDMPRSTARREAFTPEEYRKLYEHARGWVRKAENRHNLWYRKMAQNFMLIMANTGMRNSEARNLKWRDIHTRTAKDGRMFVAMNVRGKGKYREMIAAGNVADYLERIRALFIEAEERRLEGAADSAPGPKPDDAVFSTHQGKPALTLYKNLIGDLLEDAGLLYSSSGSRRSIYSFRHTYATFRLMSGTDVYFLAKNMGTSVKMIEDHYGHITPTKNADRILGGIAEWEAAAASGEPDGSVNAAAAGSAEAAGSRVGERGPAGKKRARERARPAGGGARPRNR